MTSDRRGYFVTIDGLGGAGKSTTARLLASILSDRGYSVCTTTQPSHDQLGTIARYGTARYSGYSLACLVAADRYHHQELIRHNLSTGNVVVCDRYVPSSYVLQRMDGVPIEFIEAINAATDVPDLAVILTAEPEVTAARINQRGTHTRFETGAESSRTETQLYNEAMERLAVRGYPLVTLDTTDKTPDAVAAVIADGIAQRMGLPPSPGASA